MGQEVLEARGRTLDAGALIAIERGDERIRSAISRPGRHIIPSPVLAQVWRDGSRQARLAKFLFAKSTFIEAFDELSARAAGAVLARSGTSDVVDASVVVCARRHNTMVLSSDAADLLRIDPTLDVQEI